MSALPRVARVVPDVTGLDKVFDYAVADAEGVELGALVRVPLHGRRVGGWVVELDPPDGAIEAARLKPIAKVSSIGPGPDLLELTRWASVRWAAGRLRPFLTAASPPGMVPRRPPPARGAAAPDAVAEDAAGLLAAGGGVLRLPPHDDLVAVVAAAAALGPTLVVTPSVARASWLAGRLRRLGRTVAVVPGEWGRAAGGVDVVVGPRVAAWAPCPGLAAVVVVDEHDEALQEERAPTWHARDVLVERARRAGAPALLTSPCPTVVGLAATGGRLVARSRDDERASWPIVEVVDRTRDEPWKTSLVTSELIRHLRDPDRVVVCVHNTTGRARLLACRSCRALVRCAHCDAAVGLADDGRLVCRRCGTARPPVCLACGASAFANLRPGVTRLREELAAAAGRDVVAVTGSDEGSPEPVGVYVGTEAVLHRVGRADTVAFLDLDGELLAPRYRAAEQAMALIVRGARLARRRADGGRLLLQTFLPRHDVVQAALLADPGRMVPGEEQRRRLLGLPPFAALATVSGPGSDEVASALASAAELDVGGEPGDHVVRGPDWLTLGRALIDAPRPKGSRVRIAVDPPRR